MKTLSLEEKGDVTGMAKNHEAINSTINEIDEQMECLQKSQLKVEVVSRLFRAQSYEDQDELGFYLGLELLFQEVVGDMIEIGAYMHKLKGQYEDMLNG